MKKLETKSNTYYRTPASNSYAKFIYKLTILRVGHTKNIQQRK